MILRYISRGKLRGRSNICRMCRNNFSIKFSLPFWDHIYIFFFNFQFQRLYGLHFEKRSVEFMLHLRYQILQLSCQKTISIYVKNWNKFLSINFFRIRRKNKNKKPYKNKSCFRRNIKWIKKKIHTFGRYIQQNNIKTTPTQWLINLTNYF